MALDLMMSHRNSTNLEENAVREAASGLESVHKLIWLLSQQQEQQQQSSSSNSRSGAGAGGSPPSMDIDLDCKAVADVAVSKFKKVISLLGQTRTGHARFRRAPPPPLPPPISVSHVPPQTQESQEVLESNKVYYATPIQQIPPNHPIPSVERNLLDSSAKTINFSYSSIGNSSFISSLTGDTDTKQQHPSSSSSAFQITNLSQVSSSCGKPPMSSTSSLKRKCSSENLGSGKCGASSSSGRCHCSKKSKRLKLKRVVRVPAISLKMSDIPPDDYSWRKYGQKPIKGSPHPRGYYKCSSVRGCPARKHVERALDDASVQVVTYEGEHNHAISVAETSSLILESS